jgi:two-component system, OmpR family, KDP operon response regulator KdpE
MAKRVLIIEDGPGTQAVLQAVLEAEGYEVCVAATAAQALACLDDHPDVILLAQHLPDMPADELVKTIKAQSPIPVLVLTSEQALGQNSILRTMADATHSKPFNLRLLFKQLAVLLESVQSHRAGLSLSELCDRLTRGGPGNGRRRRQASQ